MKKNTIIPVSLFIIGEILIIIGFIRFNSNTELDILILNITISSIIYFINFSDFLIPENLLASQNQAKFGGLGIHWVVNLCYSIAAITLMVVLEVIYKMEFFSQITIQSGLLFLFLLGLYLSSKASTKTFEVQNNESKLSASKREILSLINRLQQNILKNPNISHDILTKIKKINETTRFLAPNDRPEAGELEEKIKKELESLYLMSQETSINEEMLTETIDQIDQTLMERKNVYR